ncbi:NAD(P)H-dependent flavin oxidoreductase YrpB (nitropropane dioxygenase family) [Nitrospirillum amazonense]|uniref:NAD(P)H-dependent flavin oxidoreductase YrpB (Nitropropane dioxygenase family) n=1 Tax=Nitrospirillum amazonense TaxID=28077 RepID=A0A560J4E5_9PROT|nr:nitronate monooxygenase [Nitrospirillum amazonense]TWB18391.1 NAD(P)H-dependent flavin oxidoreductase YrpB (nitropropane dioxygenase family) [Nitrospirillum amazonense]TWB66088.1 NAD(P)H-dependent flavin oxidoreductase YrpB (nitropropane dioxygenase family) [Nitrospirillum amazonense]
MQPDPLITALVERLGCRYPIIQTAMGWVAEPPLVAASCNAGAFGFLGAAVMTPADAAAKIAAVRRLTDRPFGVNFHMFQPGAAEIVETIIANRAQVRAVSFGRGPDAAMIVRFRDAGILCVPTVGALKHAKKMVQLGVDMINVQGGEGGGHTGSVPTTVLLPQVLDTVTVPVIASGGFADGRGLAAALAFGAVGIAMGTRFLLTAESPVPAVTKARYLEADTDDIVLTTKLDGIPQRMVRTPLMDRIERSGPLGMWLRALESGLALKRQTGAGWGELLHTVRGMTGHGGLRLDQALMAASAPMLIQKAVVEGKPDEGVMATGIVGGRLTEIPTCQALMDRIVAEARERLAALCPAPVDSRRYHADHA